MLDVGAAQPLVTLLVINRPVLSAWGCQVALVLKIRITAPSPCPVVHRRQRYKAKEKGALVVEVGE